MNGQQAPTSRPTFSARQSSRPAPSHTASMSRNLISGGTISQIRYRPASVNRTLIHLLNRFMRSQPMAPAAARGGAMASIILVRANARLTASSVMLALHQPDARVVQVHEQAGNERDRQVDRHRDDDDLDRLPGLVQRRPGEHREQVG